MLKGKHYSFGVIQGQKIAESPSFEMSLSCFFWATSKKPAARVTHSSLSLL